MINLKNINFSYLFEEFQLKIPRMQIDSGQAVAVIGASGSGKTTLLSILAGILTVNSGDIILDNMDLKTLNNRQRRLFRLQHIGFIFQDFALIEYLTLWDNILHPYRINAELSLNKSVKEKASALADKLGITSRLKHFPQTASAGEQQRCAVARALLNSPKIILADEPTGNLDPLNKKAIMQYLIHYAHNSKSVLLVATHDYEWLDLFDRVIDLGKEDTFHKE